jgi:putative PIN family toxin of toxin-antitoxin system
MIPLRLVVDTNIFVSAAIKPDGLQRTVVTLALAKPARLYVSPEIIAEYRGVLSRAELGIRRGPRRQLLDLIETRAYLVRPVQQLQVTRDPNDNIFLECADAARADYLITGNTRDFPAYWKSTKVVSSRDFLSLAAPHILP